MNNDAVISLVHFVDTIIEQWQESMSVIDPEYGYMNEDNESKALEMKQEFRSLLNLALFPNELR